MKQTRRLFCFFLVTFLFLANCSKAIATDSLSDKIDQDLFLEDEGSGFRPDDESSGVGPGEDGDDDNPDGTHEPKKTGGNVSFKEKTNEPDPIPPVDVIDANKGVLEKNETPASFFSQPGILAAIICGAIVGLLCAILLVMFIVYRMRKKDEGSYVLDDSKRTATTYGKSKEFYA